MEPYLPDGEHRARLLEALTAVREKGTKVLEASLIAAINVDRLTADSAEQIVGVR